MWLKTIMGNDVTFLFESSNDEHAEFMTQTATGVRGKSYTIGAGPTEVPDVVGGYGLANSPGIEECDAPLPAGSCEAKVVRKKGLLKVNDVCGRPKPCQYHD